MPEKFNDEAVVVVLDDSGKAAFQRYLDSGGNFVGIHSASDCLVNTTFYGDELGTQLSILKEPI